jgi:hypothetical protein
MAVGSQRGTSNRARSRGRVSSNGSSASSKRSTSAATRQSGSATTQSRSASSKRSTSRSRASANKGSASSGSTGSARSASSNGRSQDHSTRETIANIGIPVVSATIGVAGGVLLGRTALQRNRKFLGIPLPLKIDMAGVTQQIGEAGKQIGEAGKQFGKLAGEVRTVREKAEEIGKAIT